MQFFTLLLSYLGWGGITGILFLAALMMSFADSNIWDALLLGVPMLVTTLMVSLALSPEEDDDKKTANKKVIAQHVWNNIMVAVLALLIYLSGAHFAASVFMLIGFLAVCSVAGEAIKGEDTYKIKSFKDFWIPWGTISPVFAAVWTFLTTIEWGFLLNDYDPVFQTYDYNRLHNYTAAGYAIFLIFLAFSAVLVLYDAIIKILELLTKPRKKYYRMYEFDSLFVFPIVPIHLAAIILGRYAMTQRDFVVLLTNFCIDDIEVDYIVYGCTLLVSLAIILAMYYTEKKIKSEYGNEYFRDHFSKYCYPALALLAVLNIVLPLGCMKVEDPTSDLAMRLERASLAERDKKKDKYLIFHNDVVPCPVCKEKSTKRDETTLWLRGEEIYCNLCKNTWYVNSLDTIEKIQKMEKERWK